VFYIAFRTCERSLSYPMKKFDLDRDTVKLESDTLIGMHGIQRIRNGPLSTSRFYWFQIQL